MSYFGLNLLLNLAVPIALATVAQMFVLCVNDLDLSIGAFVSLVACIAATWLNDTPLLGVLALAALVAAYAGMGALIHLRAAAVDRRDARHVLRLARARDDGAADPGRQGARLAARADDAEALAGAVPDHRLASSSPLVVHVGLMRSPYGVVLRGAGGNPRAVERAGWSMLRVKVTMFALAGFFGVLSGMALVGLTTSADANIALRYTLLSIAGVILGGGEFVGGRVSPVGAVIGAMTLTLAGSLLSFLRLNPDWQIGAQGAILILVLALRVLIDRAEARA